jgi:hypothetical protein
MTLPSILLLLAFVFGIGAALSSLVFLNIRDMQAWVGSD